MVLSYDEQTLNAFKATIGHELVHYEESGIWYVYDTNDRGGIVIVDKGGENEMTEALYRRVLKAEKRLLKKE